MLDGRGYLFSAFGEVNWVRNLRAVGIATIRVGRQRETLRAAELSAEEAGPVIRSILGSRDSRVPGRESRASRS